MRDVAVRIRGPNRNVQPAAGVVSFDSCFTAACRGRQTRETHTTITPRFEFDFCLRRRSVHAPGVSSSSKIYEFGQTFAAYMASFPNQYIHGH